MSETISIEITAESLLRLAKLWLDFPAGIDGGCPYCTEVAFEGLATVFPALLPLYPKVVDGFPELADMKQLYEEVREAQYE